MQNDDGDDDGIEDGDGDGIPDEVEEVGEALWQHDLLLYNLRAHYASLNSSLDSLTLNSWTELINESRLSDSAHMITRDGTSINHRGSVLHTVRPILPMRC